VRPCVKTVCEFSQPTRVVRQPPAAQLEISNDRLGQDLLASSSERSRHLPRWPFIPVGARHRTINTGPAELRFLLPTDSIEQIVYTSTSEADRSGAMR
jgi:hypothetical protein